MNKYYKKFSNSGICFLNSGIHKRDTIFSDLGSTINKMNRQNEEANLIETPAYLEGKRIRIHRKHRTDRTQRPDAKELKYSKNTEYYSCKLESRQKHDGKGDKFLMHDRRSTKEPKIRDEHFRRIASPKDEDKELMNIRELKENRNVRHLYEDSKTEIFYINEGMNRRYRKKSRSPKHIPDKILQRDYQKEQSLNLNAYEGSTMQKAQGDYENKSHEKPTALNNPVTVATLSQLEHYFYRGENADDPRKNHRHNAYLIHGKKKRYSQDKLRRKGHLNLLDNNSGLELFKKDDKLKPRRAMLPIEVEVGLIKSKHKKEHSREHRRKVSKDQKDGKASLHLSEKYKKSVVKASNDADPPSGMSPTRSLFQSFHMNLGKIFMPDKHQNFKTGEGGVSRISEEKKVKHPLGKSKDKLRKMNNTKHKSEPGISVTPSRVTPVPSKSASVKSTSRSAKMKNHGDDLKHFERDLEHRLFGIYNKTKHNRAIIQKTADVTKENTPPSAWNATILANLLDKQQSILEPSDYSRVVRQMKELLSQFPARDKAAKEDFFKNHFGYYSFNPEYMFEESPKSRRIKLSRKEIVKRLSRTSYFCLFEHPKELPTTVEKLQKSKSKSSTKIHHRGKRQMVYCQDTLDIEHKMSVATQRSGSLIPRKDSSSIDTDISLSQNDEEVLVSVFSPVNSKSEEVLRLKVCNLKSDASQTLTATNKGSIPTPEVCPKDDKENLNTRVDCSPVKPHKSRLFSFMTFQVENILPYNVMKTGDKTTNDRRKFKSKLKGKREETKCYKTEKNLEKAVFNTVEISPVHEGVPVKLKPAIKKVSFPDIEADEIEETIERKKKLPAFRRYYQYNNSPETKDMQSQTHPTNYLSDVNDQFECDDYSDNDASGGTILSSKQPNPRIADSLHKNKMSHTTLGSRIPRPTKHDLARRRDLCSSSETSHQGTLAEANKTQIRKKKVMKTKQTSEPIQKQSRQTEVYKTKKSVLEEKAVDVTKKATKEVGINCFKSTSISPDPLKKKAEVMYPSKTHKSRTSSIATDSDVESTISSWNLIKKPSELHTTSYSGVENPPSNNSNNCPQTDDVYSSTEVRYITYTPAPVLYSRHNIPRPMKSEGKNLYREIVKQVDEEADKPLIDTDQKDSVEAQTTGRTYNIKASEPPCIQSLKPLPKVEVSDSDDQFPVDLKKRARSFLEENKNICNRIRHYKMKAKEEEGKRKTKTSNDTCSVSSSYKSLGIKRSCENKGSKGNLSVITSKSDMNISHNVTSEMRPRLTSLITLESFTISKPLVQRIPPVTKNKRRYNSQTSHLDTPKTANPSFFLTKDFKGDSAVSSYQKRKLYDRSIRRILKMRSQSEDKKCIVPPQVFEVRYVTVSSEMDDQSKFVTRGTQNTAEQACQVSQYSSNSSESFGQILRCVSLENVKETERYGAENFCGLSFDSYQPSSFEKMIEKKCSGCARYVVSSRSIKNRNSVKKKTSKNHKVEKQVKETEKTTPHSAKKKKDKERKNRKRASKTIRKVLATGDPQVVMESKRRKSKTKNELLWDPKDNFAYNCSTKSEIKKGFFKFNFPYYFPVNKLQIKDGKADEEKHGHANCSLRDFCNVLFCCCLYDVGEPPRKKRKCTKEPKKSSSKRHHRNSRTCQETQSTTQNFRVQMNKMINIKCVKSGANVNLVFSDSNDKHKKGDVNKDKRHNSKVKSNREFFHKLSPTEWFKNISSYVYLEQNVGDWLDKFSDELLAEQGDGKLEEKFHCPNESVLSSIFSSNSFAFDEDKNSIVSNICSRNNKIAFDLRLRRAKSEIVMKNCEFSTPNVKTHLLKSQSLLSCSSLPNTRSSFQSHFENHAIQSQSTAKYNKGDDKTLDDTENKESSIAIADLDLPDDVGLDYGSYRSRYVDDFVQNNLDMSTSGESGYTSLPSKRTPSAMSFFKRRSIIELLKFPLERKVSKVVFDVDRCENEETKNISYPQGFICNKIGDSECKENFMRVSCFSKMTKDCQLYAHKVRMLSEKRRDGLYEEVDNFKEISLDILLGKGPKVNKDKQNQSVGVQVEPGSSVVVQNVETSTSEENTFIPVLEDDPPLKIDDLEENRLSDAEEVISIRNEIVMPNVDSKNTKISKSDGNLRLKIECYQENQMQIPCTKSESCFGKQYDRFRNTNLQVMSLDNFSTSSDKDEDKNFFQTLLKLYEREIEVSEGLYADDEFFSAQLDSVDRNVECERKKAKHRFMNIFRRKQKNFSKVEVLYEECELVAHPKENESVNSFSQVYLDGISGDTPREDIASPKSLKAESLETKALATPQNFQLLACKVKRKFAPLVRAICANKFMNDDLKFTGFLKLLERIEHGDLVMLQTNIADGLEDRVKDQVRQAFSLIYRVVKDAVSERKLKVSQSQLNLVKIYVTKYRVNLPEHMEIVGLYIGRGLIVTEKQLQAASAYLARTDKAKVDCGVLEKVIVDTV